MPLLILSDDLLLCVADDLEESDINNLTRTNRRLHSLLNSFLYGHHIRYFGGFALLWAAFYGQLGTAEKLLTQGANPNIMLTHDYHITTKTVDREKPIQWLLPDSKKNHESMRLDVGNHIILLPSLPIFEQIPPFCNPLYLACWQGHLAVVRLLMEVSTIDKNSICRCCGEMFLGKVAMSGRTSIVRYLLQYGVEPSLPGKMGRTALMAACLHAPSQTSPNSDDAHEKVVKLLVNQSDIDINTRSYDGRTALLAATEGGSEAVIKILLAHGANPNATDLSGNTPLSIATENNNEAVRKLLLAIQGEQTRRSLGYFCTPQSACTL